MKKEIRYAVRTKDGSALPSKYTTNLKGEIIKGEQSPNYTNYFDYGDNSSIANFWRLATDLEIEAYKQGIRNIKDIPKTFNQLYKIY